ncbi:hypothetical protein [Flavobacterium hungaricum]|uniref:Uncharacterized protein n=1 Tax=Flavobacterium hungaricum TaxID=2082725 RepID=A0ABR9TIE7_9FLAO|nr:hypothetical protein [Flavobacterium hungaricum]MBE8725126.1 hypothetical protein [Flavobacterium hungaricum]
MSKITDFIINNKAPLLIGFFCVGVYFYFALAGNRICDCETTEKYSTPRSHNSRIYNSRNHFYHK